ncbi:MAG: methionine adenosyltransferase [Thiotrichales bacterium]
MSCTIESAAPAPLRIEVVERKGIGHPDTICDALAETFSLALSRWYLNRFGEVLHHNVDKVLLWGGAARPNFGGGEILAPIEIFLAGRAVTAFKGVAIPVEQLAIESARKLLERHWPDVNVTRDVRIHTLIRPGSVDLAELYARKTGFEVPLANDTSCGVGFAPLTPLETLVLDLERSLDTKCTPTHRALGADRKVMGVRLDDRLELTLGCAMVDRHLANLADYRDACAWLAAHATSVAERHGFPNATIRVNAADNPERGSVFMTVSGTSAEAGDDGEAGRGNRANGLITPCRPMTLESVAGKNPITHVGKLYNLLAGLIASDAAELIPESTSFECYLVSRIGFPIDAPPLSHLRATTSQPLDPGSERRLRTLVHDRLATLPSLWRLLLDGQLKLDRWPWLD